MLWVSLFGGVVGMLTFAFLNALRGGSGMQFRVGRTSSNPKYSLEAPPEPQKSETDLQRRALRNYFGDASGRVPDLRMLRSAMYISDEIDRALRGSPEENRGYGYRQYNRFYADGIQDQFTNVPSGRSQLVMAAPTSTIEPVEQDPTQTRLVQYKATRDAMFQQVGRVLKRVEHEALVDLSRRGVSNLSLAQQTYVQQQEKLRADQSGTVRSSGRGAQLPLPPGASSEEEITVVPRYSYQPQVSKDLQASMYQPYTPLDGTAPTK